MADPAGSAGGGAGNVAAGLRNTLVPAGPPLRIRARLGDLDLVFDPVTTVLGKKQRLQAMGYYYEPITGAAAGEAVTEAFTNCLLAWQARRLLEVAPLVGNAAIEADLQSSIRRFVVTGDTPADNSFTIPLADTVLPAVGGLVQVLVPGTFTFQADADLGDGGSPRAAGLPSLRFNADGALWTNNPALGLIPIIALVEEQRPDSTWVVSPNRTVHFQLIAPFHDAPAEEMSFVTGQRNTSQQGTLAVPVVMPNAGPAPFITTAMANSFDAANPQMHNAHTNRGGKRGGPLTPDILDSLPNAKFPNMAAVSASARPNAVQARTNAAGEAGVMFKPSRMGGDRYRFRIFVDPVVTRASDGTGAGAVVHETGRFVVSKHILMQRFLVKPFPALPASNAAEGIQMRLAILGYDPGLVDGLFWGQSQAALRRFQGHYGLPQNGNMNHANTQARLDLEVTNYVAGFGPNMANFQFSMFRNQYYQMYSVTEDTPAQLTTAVPMTQADYLAALQYAKTQAQLNITNNGPGPYFMSQRYDVNTMIPEYWETPYLFMVAPPAHYTRRRKPAGIPANAPAALRYWRDAMGLIYAANGLIDLFMRYFTGNGQVTPPTPTVSVNSSPGISLVGCLAPSPMFVVPPTQAGLSLPAVFPSFSNNDQNLVGASGIARKERGCFIFGGQPYYATFGHYTGNADQTYSKNSMHEFGHTLYLRHHITNAANGNYVGGNFGEDHDNGDRCLMGYVDCEGEYCGKCHLKIRGWDISQMPV